MEHGHSESLPVIGGQVTDRVVMHQPSSPLVTLDYADGAEAEGHAVKVGQRYPQNLADHGSDSEIMRYDDESFFPGASPL
jgi:hypothetical protein